MGWGDLGDMTIDRLLNLIFLHFISFCFSKLYCNFCLKCCGLMFIVFGE